MSTRLLTGTESVDIHRQFRSACHALPTTIQPSQVKRCIRIDRDKDTNSFGCRSLPRRNNVPSKSTTGQMINRRESSSHQVGGFIRCRSCYRKPQILRHTSHCTNGLSSISKLSSLSQDYSFRKGMPELTITGSAIGNCAPLRKHGSALFLYVS